MTCHELKQLINQHNLTAKHVATLFSLYMIIDALDFYTRQEHNKNPLTLTYKEH